MQYPNWLTQHWSDSTFYWVKLFRLAYATLVHAEMNAMWPCLWSWRVVLKVMGRKSSSYPAPPHKPNPCSCKFKTTPLGFQEQLCFGAIYYPWSWRVMANVVDRKPSSSLPKKCEILNKESVNRSQRWKKSKCWKGKGKTEETTSHTTGVGWKEPVASKVLPLMWVVRDEK